MEPSKKASTLRLDSTRVGVCGHLCLYCPLGVHRGTYCVLELCGVSILLIIVAGRVSILRVWLMSTLGVLWCVLFTLPYPPCPSSLKPYLT